MMPKRFFRVVFNNNNNNYYYYYYYSNNNASVSRIKLELITSELLQTTPKTSRGTTTTTMLMMFQRQHSKHDHVITEQNSSRDSDVIADLQPTTSTATSPRRHVEGASQVIAIISVLSVFCSS